MNDKKYLVPNGMRRAAGAATHNVDPEGYIMLPGLEAAVGWLAENPIVPNMDQVADISKASIVDPHRTDLFVHYICAEWQRRMFLAPESETLKVSKLDKLHSTLKSTPWRKLMVEFITLYICPACKAVVQDAVEHAAWHLELGG